MSRAAYYKWLHREIPENEQQNRRIADEIEKIHAESPDKGYRRIRDDLERYHDIDVNTILQKKFHTLLKESLAVAFISIPTFESGFC